MGTHDHLRPTETPRTKLADLGNLSVASLIFAALLREERLTEFTIVLGAAILVAA